MARYRIVSERSRLWAEARSSLHPIRVETGTLDGFFEVEIGNGHLDLGVPPNGSLELETDSLKTGNRLYDRELETQLQVRKFPCIHGETREVVPLDHPSHLHVRGDLTLRGVTKSIEGNVTLRKLDDNTVEVEGEKVIDLREFGLQPPRFLLLKVYPDVKIRARIVGVRES